MHNEWNNLSDSFSSRQKQLASVKVKKKSPIYKHIVLRKFSKIEEPDKPEIEIKNEFLLLPKNDENQRSKSFCNSKIESRSGLYYNKYNINENFSSLLSTAREGSFEVSFLKNKSEMPSYFKNSIIKLGKKISNLNKIKVLQDIAKKQLEIQNDSVIFQCFYEEREKKFNVICYGENAPKSECCKLDFIVQLSMEFGGKIICPNRNCVISCLNNFFIGKENRHFLWEVNQEQKKNHTENTKSKYYQEIDLKNFKGLHNGLYFGNSKTISAPKDAFSVYIDPLQKVLKSHKKLRH